MTRRASSRPLGPDHVWGLGLGFGTVGVFVLRRAVASQLYGVEPTDLMRKVCGGNRSARGAHTQQVLASVLRTTHQRGLDPTSILVTLLRAPIPIVPLPLQAPPQ